MSTIFFFNTQAPVPPIDPEEYPTAYSTLFTLITTREEELEKRDFPDTIEETLKLLDKFKEQKEEEKVKEQEIGEMEKELTEFQEKHKIDLQLPQFTDLEKVVALFVILI